ncbi:MAG: hypothetical protein NTU56_06680 [Proteobacteria bacterium]|nr:hypothetical protein [Pseudomonadota bacterium]
MQSIIQAYTMEPTAALGASAQIAVAIAGFAGVVAAFRNDSVHDWGPVERFWLRLLLINSILPLALCMIGLFLLSVSDDMPSTWRWCSGISTLLLIPYAAMIVRTVAGFAPGQLEAAGGNRFTSYVLIILLTIVCLLQVWNLATLAAFWPFFGAIVAQLLGAMYQFVRLVLSPRRPAT